MKISLIIDARLTGKELPRRLAEARQQVALFQGRGEILVIDDGDMVPPLLGEPGEHAVVGYRQVRSRPAPMGRRLNLAASHSNGRMLGFCLGPLDTHWVERMMAAACDDSRPVVRPARPCPLSLLSLLRRTPTRALGVERTWFDRLGGFDPSLDLSAVEDLATRLKACRAKMVVQRA